MTIESIVSMVLLGETLRLGVSQPHQRHIGRREFWDCPPAVGWSLRPTLLPRPTRIGVPRGSRPLQDGNLPPPPRYICGHSVGGGMIGVKDADGSCEATRTPPRASLCDGVEVRVSIATMTSRKVDDVKSTHPRPSRSEHIEAGRPGRPLHDCANRRASRFVFRRLATGPAPGRTGSCRQARPRIDRSAPTADRPARSPGPLRPPCMGRSPARSSSRTSRAPGR